MYPSWFFINMHISKAYKTSILIILTSLLFKIRFKYLKYSSYIMYIDTHLHRCIYACVYTCTHVCAYVCINAHTRT